MRLVVSVLALALAVAAPAHAQFNAAEQDLRCALVGLTVAGGDDEASAKAGAMMVTYFIGRLEGRDPRIKLKEQLEAQIAIMDRMKQDDLNRLGDNCFGLLQASQKTLATLAPAAPAAPAAP